MNILQAINSKLRSSTAIVSLSSNRIYPMIAYDGIKKPYITFHQISNAPVHAMETDADINSYRIQVSSWTTSFSGLIALSTQIKAALRDFSGTLGTSNFIAQRIFFDSESDFPEYNSEMNTITYHRSQDFIVWTTC